MRPTVAIVALGALNRRSIAKALERAGANVRFADEPTALREADALVIPGVANVAYLIEALDRRELREPLLAAIETGVPCLGICAGFQLLFEASDEAPGARGLGIFAGTVRRTNGPKSPHIGWNRVVPVDESQQSDWAYFAHAYAAPADVRDVAAITTFGSGFASIATRGSVKGVQFHPERSARYGAELLAQFVADARCIYAC
jgi:imidazole glycerol phosphate synthase glutamine amidotransferase subunit